MFGKKRHSEIIARLDKIEQQQRTNYHMISSELACIERQIEDLQLYMEQMDFPNTLDAIDNIKTQTDFIATVFEKASIQTEPTDH